MPQRVDQPRIRVALPRTPEAGALARAVISRQLAAQLSVESLLHAKLVASELVNNAYQHGRGQIRLELELASRPATHRGGRRRRGREDHDQ